MGEIGVFEGKGKENQSVADNDTRKLDVSEDGSEVVKWLEETREPEPKLHEESPYMQYDARNCSPYESSSQRGSPPHPTIYEEPLRLKTEINHPVPSPAPLDAQSTSNSHSISPYRRKYFQ